jgi:allantoate deiminase
MKQAAEELMRRLDELGLISEEVGQLTRTFCSEAMKRANDLVEHWMREAGMSTRRDAIGNLIGKYEGERKESKTLIIGSHLDTVRDAGKYDGPLGVLMGVSLVQVLNARKHRLPFSIEVVGFADEEGVRYHSTYLGSKVLAGTFEPGLLALADAKGMPMREAIRQFGSNPEALESGRIDSKKTIGYVEVHIEQGPVLEQKHLSVGVVTAIAGQTRVILDFIGKAGHAGTTPMSLRKDALCAGAEFVLAAESVGFERGGLVATVGQLFVQRGASNVIPGAVKMSLDVRHPVDAIRTAAVHELRKHAEQIAGDRKLRLEWKVAHETGAVNCDKAFLTLMNRAVEKVQGTSVLLYSGAGHDAAAMAAVTPVSMLFVRCKDGLSHHPDESVRTEDVAVALETMEVFLGGVVKEQTA